MASISLCVGKRVWKGEAAFVNGSDLDGKGILAVEAWEIMSEFRESTLQVNVVETRHQARERESVEQIDKVCMVEENAGSNLFKGDKDEVVSASEEDELRLADEKVLDNVEGESDKASEMGVEADALDYACVLKGSDREKFVEEVKNDSSLTPLKDLADMNASGMMVYSCRDIVMWILLYLNLDAVILFT